MKKLIVEIASDIFKYPLTFAPLKDELNKRMLDEKYTTNDLMDEYSKVFTILHNREVRRKLKSINSVLVFFAVLSIISLAIGFIVALASVSV